MLRETSPSFPTVSTSEKAKIFLSFLLFADSQSPPQPEYHSGVSGQFPPDLLSASIPGSVPLVKKSSIAPPTGGYKGLQE